jgi:hypothetical protein
MFKKVDSSIAILKNLDSFVAHSGQGVQFNKHLLP